MSFHVGEDIGDYRIVSIIGAGSMGQVFQAEHRITRRKEALKVLVASCATENQVQRFQREIEVQARLDHPNIARVHNALHLNESLILIMELVGGESLEKKLLKGTVSRTAGIEYICQALSALEYAHDGGVVHRDVTPGNLIVDQNGHVKLTDFGVAKSLGDYQLTNAGEIVGSLYYMPPEQVRRQTDPDPRSDIYSVGAVLYEVLTGKKLFDCADRLSLMVAQVQKTPIPPVDIDPSIGFELNEIVIKAIAKDPAERYQSARAFFEALQPFVKKSMEPAISQSVPRHNHFPRAPLGAVATLALAFTGGLGRRALEPQLLLPTPPTPRYSFALAIQPVASPRVFSSNSETGKTMFAQHRQPTVRQRPAEEASNAQPGDENPKSLGDVENAAPVEEANAAPVDTSEITSEPAAAAQEPVHVSRKRQFWSKLNPFKRKKADPEFQKSFVGR